MYLHYLTIETPIKNIQKVIKSHNEILNYKEFKNFIIKNFWENDEWIILNHTIINDLYNNTLNNE